MKKRIIITISSLSIICIAIVLSIIFMSNKEYSINVIDTILGRDNIYLKYDVETKQEYDFVIVEIDGALDSEYIKTKEVEFNTKNIYEVSFDALTFNNEYNLSISTKKNKTKTLIEVFTLTPNLGSKDNPFLINTIDDFFTLNTYNGDFFKLEQDLDFSDIDYNSSFVNKFSGELDGNNHSLNNISFDSYALCSIFSELSENGYINNLQLNNIRYSSRRFSDIILGGLVNNNYGTIENITINNLEIITNGNSDGAQTIGGLVGNNFSSGVIKNSKITNSSININVPEASYVGGFVGVNEGNIDNCVVIDTNIICSYNTSINSEYDIMYSTNIYIGGFCGTNNSIISNSSTNSNIAFFVLGTKTGGKYNVVETHEEQRPQNLDDLSVYISDFCAYSETITLNCTSTTTIIDIENAFIDELYIEINSEVIETLNITVVEDTVYTINKAIQYSLTYREEVTNEYNDVEFIFTKIK